jgi:ribonuclease HI
MLNGWASLIRDWKSMQITREFIELGFASSTLNKAQCNLLELDFPLNDNWEELVIGKELTLKETNLFLFLRGKLAIKAQEQIIKNYDLVANFHKEQKKKKEEPKKSKSKTIEIYCDGACEGNPGKAVSGLAIYNLQDKPILLYGQYTQRGTNNTAELNALYKALLIASEHPNSIIKTDSMYSLDCISNWAYSWKKKGWTRKGKEIKNLEIIKISHALYDSIKDKVTIKHVKGHAGFEGNELADRMAGLAIREKNSEYKEFKYKSISEVLKMREDK